MTNTPTPAGMAELRDAITLILPLAKGYAAAHPVGSNQSYVDYVEALIAAQPSAGAEPVAVTLFCPECSLPHVDEGEWATRPHKTHQCQGCGHEWRPFPFATVGVTHPAPVLTAETREGLQNLKGQLERIAAEAPDDQPHYRNGVRPFGTGDLRHFIQVLSDATATPVQPDSGGAVEALATEPTMDMCEAGAAAIVKWRGSRGTLVQAAQCFMAMDAIRRAALAPVAAVGGERELDDLDRELIDRSFRTVQAYDAVRLLQTALSDTMKRQHAGYDWNADPDQMTLKQSEALALATKVFADLSAAVDAHPDFSDEVFEAALRTEPTGGGETEDCPICAVTFKPDDLCATDITEGTCHAACLKGSPIVDLETGETGGAL